MEIVIEGWINDKRYGIEPVKANLVFQVNDNGEVLLTEVKPINK